MVVRKSYKLKQVVITPDEKKHYEQSLEVNVQNKGKSTYYQYVEKLDEHELRCVLKVDDTGVKISRRGIINMNFSFVEGEMTDTFYESLAGRHHFFVYTKEIITDDSKIEIIYDLFEGQEKLGTYHYSLKKEA